MSVAENAGIGRPALKVVLDKRIDDTAAKFLFKIQHIIWDFELLCHSPCIIHRAQTAAAAVFLHCTLFLILPYLHGHPDYIVPLLLQQICCHRGIHPA